MKISKRISLIGLLSALAIVLSTLEQYVPLQAVVPLPGIKLGIANVITLFILSHFSYKEAMAVLLIRCAVVSMLFGNVTGLAMSLTGGILSLLVMTLLLRFNRLFTIFGVSIAGAACHNIGQILCAVVLLKNVYIAAYLPLLLLSSFVTGSLIAALFKIVNQYKIPTS